MRQTEIEQIVTKELEKSKGLLRLKPAWVARTFLTPGKRLSLKEDQYAVGKRGFICERWLGSETEADNGVKQKDEGLSMLACSDAEILLRDAVAVCKNAIMGKDYARDHANLGRLAKLFDFGCRIFFHYHQVRSDAFKLGRTPKEEAYYFPIGVDLGPHPETFFGVHPSIVEQGRQYEVLLPYLKEWNGDSILMHSRAYANVPGDGFHLPAGLLHAPGTALTMELQEPSDVMGVLQARVEGWEVSKNLLSKDIPPAEYKEKGERAALDQLLWKENGDPYFYEHHHTPPVEIDIHGIDGVTEQWIYYNTTRFSGKRLVLKPGAKFLSKEKGVYNILVWRGAGRAGGLDIAGQKFDFDELLVTHDTAATGVLYENTGKTDLELFKFFGPDINNDNVPWLAEYQGR
jgi:hypothetical protein